MVLVLVLIPVGETMNRRATNCPKVTKFDFATRFVGIIYDIVFAHSFSCTFSLKRKVVGAKNLGTQ